MIDNTGCCFLCLNVDGNYNFKDLEEHHIFFGRGKRELADEDGLTVQLCIEHHRTGKEAVHKNRTSDLLLKVIGQAKYEETHTREEFIKRYGKSYI